MPAGGELDFERGGNHLMLEGLKQKPKEGDKVSLGLHFATSGTVTVTVPVKAATYNPTAKSSALTSMSSHTSPLTAPLTVREDHRSPLPAPVAAAPRRAPAPCSPAPRPPPRTPR